MNKLTIAIVIIGTGTLIGISAYAVRSEARVEPKSTSRPSQTLEELKPAVDAGEWNAILMIGETGDRSAIPFLRELLNHPNQRAWGGPVWNAQMALAKLGDRVELERMIKDLRADHPWLVTKAANQLSYVGGAEATVALAALLADQRGFRRAEDTDDVLYEPPSHLAVKALSQIVPDGPTRLRMDDPVKDEDLELWRAWWASNRGETKEK